MANVMSGPPPSPVRTRRLISSRRRFPGVVGLNLALAARNTERTACLPFHIAASPERQGGRAPSSRDLSKRDGAAPLRPLTDVYSKHGGQSRHPVPGLG